MAKRLVCMRRIVVHPDSRYYRGVPKQETVGRYRLGACIGAGGTAEVYAAESSGHGGFVKRVAIKQIRRELSQARELCKAFVSEATLAQHLSHGNLVQVLDVGEENGRPFIVMEFIDGLPLSRLLGELAARKERLPLDEALFVVEEVAAGLEYAHRARGTDGKPLGLIHRDVKPHNILISREGVVKLADFGIARVVTPAGGHTMPGTVKGTVGYMAPEQALGESIDARCDQFALGVVLYELLTGRNPVREAGNLTASIIALTDGYPAIPEMNGVDAELAAIAARALAQSPAGRFADVKAMASALEHWRVHRNLPHSPAGLSSRIRRTMGEEPYPEERKIDIGTFPGLPHRHTAAGPSRGTHKKRRIVALAGAASLVATLGFLTLLIVASSKKQVIALPTPEQSPVPVPEKSVVPVPEKSPVPVPVPVPAPENPPKPTPALKRGHLKINLVPFANVRVNGAARGITPLALPLEPGHYRVELDNPETGHHRVLSTTVKSDKTVIIDTW